MSSQCLGAEAGQRVDAKVFLKPKAVVNVRLRRNLKHATSSNGRQDRICDLRHETSSGARNAVETAVRSESPNQYLEFIFTSAPLIYHGTTRLGSRMYNSCIWHTWLLFFALLIPFSRVAPCLGDLGAGITFQFLAQWAFFNWHVFWSPASTRYLCNIEPTLLSFLQGPVSG